MSIFTLKERNNIILVILLALAAFLFYASLDIIGAVLGAVVFYTIFRPLNKYLIEKKGWKSGLSSIAIIILSFFIIVVPFFFTISMVVGKIQEFSQNTAYIKELLGNIDKFAAQKLKQPHLVQDIFVRAQAVAVQIFSSVLGRVGQVLLEISIMYFLLYFMFADHRAFEGALIKYSPLSKANSIIFGQEIKNMTYSNVLGQGFIALVQGSLLMIGFLIFHIQDAVFWGIITIFLSFLPVVGAPLIFVPAAIIQISNGDTFSGVGILLWGFLLITNIDNVLRFFISKKFADTHPIIVIVGVIIGIPIFGILGLVYGPLLISGFIILTNIYVANRAILKEEEVN
ncbi:AI-2E family transporter [Solitalea sp. MAHUQ-68]|uniref:AI-2E family transporter n=1 Tax=Solitalea agri TaxID=2953739 RepID=A0A9X2JCF7_9SPHI|nr:AI-2E family transporter [Solitalea agri]MCO4293003.1 AI-2E family transporter [Solitalea agri]